MAPLLCVELSDSERSQLLAIARQSILSGLDSGNVLQLSDTELNDNLAKESAVFVTLLHQGLLRGCIGSLEATASLGQAVANAAFNAAFRDRRFAQLRVEEFDELRIEVSVLSEMQAIEVNARQDLLDSLRPGVDGLLFEDAGYRATFLPKVWDKMTSADEFLAHLLIKAGLSSDYWSNTLRFYRYQTLTFAED